MCNFSKKLNAAQRYDPTRTLTIRRAYEAQLFKRFRRLKGEINRVLVKQDGLGIDTKNPFSKIRVKQNERFNFPTDPQKVAAFMQWLREKEDEGILGVIQRPENRAAIYNEWQNKYIDASYQQGIRRANQELRKADPKVAAKVDILGSFNQPIHADAVGMLYIRNFEALDGVTKDMSQRMSRVLSQGLLEGKNPRVIARELNRQVDVGLKRARTIARTEVIKAQHTANIQEYKTYGDIGVEIIAEFVTAGDSRVCQQCQSLEGRLFTLDEAQALIPVHPNCRCIAVPKVDPNEN